VPALVDGISGVGVDDGAVGFGIGGGLSPPTPSSVESIGIPTRPFAEAEPIPVGDDADAAGLPEGAVAKPAHVPDAVPGMPAPSKRVPDVVLDIPVLVPPLKLPAGELMPVHVGVLLLVGGLTGEVPDVVGLTPADPSPVMPSGIPVGGTGAAGPIPSGEVIPSGDGALVLIWAHAGPYTNNAAIAPINMRVMIPASSEFFGAKSDCDDM
jgi:hypothetical protein